MVKKQIREGGCADMVASGASSAASSKKSKASTNARASTKQKGTIVKFAPKDKALMRVHFFFLKYDY